MVEEMLENEINRRVVEGFVAKAALNSKKTSRDAGELTKGETNKLIRKHISYKSKSKISRITFEY